MYNEHIKRELGVYSTIIDVVCRCRLQWVGHVVWHAETSMVNKVFNITLNGRRTRGCPFKQWSDMIR